MTYENPVLRRDAYWPSLNRSPEFQPSHGCLCEIKRLFGLMHSAMKTVLSHVGLLILFVALQVVVFLWSDS